MRLKRNLQGTVFLVSLFAAIYLVGYFLLGKPFAPEQFVEARSRSAAAAKEIVAFSENSVQNLSTINQLDRRDQFSEALVLVRQELENSRKAKIKAVDLIKELGEMAKETARITPARARNLATEAVREEVALITHLVVYNDVLNGLLQTLEFKFSGDIRSYGSEEVQILIENLNKEVKEINKLNESFNSKMEEFDEIV